VNRQCHGRCQAPSPAPPTLPHTDLCTSGERMHETPWSGSSEGASPKSPRNLAALGQEPSGCSPRRRCARSKGGRGRALRRGPPDTPSAPDRRSTRGIGMTLKVLELGGLQNFIPINAQNQKRAMTLGWHVTSGTVFWILMLGSNI
jgi:hypothetical protein